MKQPVYPINKTFLDHLKDGAREEYYAWRALLRENRLLVLAALLGAVTLTLLADPFPPSKFYFATGPQGTSFYRLGEKFADYFKAHGVDLVLVETAGAEQSMVQVADKDLPVSSAFVLAGTVKKGQFPGLISLGSVQYDPLWLFYRGKLVKAEDAIAYFSDKRVAVGREGSSTQTILSRILALRGIDLTHKDNLLQLPHDEAAARLIADNLDAMFIVDSMDAPIIQQLLANRDLHIFNFKLVDAYIKPLPFLEKVVIPRGSLDINSIYPAEDIAMPASTVTLLISNNTPPVIQWLFLKAADQISEDHYQFFAKPNFFPVYLDQSVPLSPIARRYYSSGLPPLAGYLPLWLAVFIDNFWLETIAVIAISIPLLRLAPSYRRIRSDMLIDKAYEELKRLETEIGEIEDRQELNVLIQKVSDLEEKISSTWISSGNVRNLYTMKSAFALVQKKAEQKADHLAGTL